ncbi:MAG: flagellar hook-associated protein FlgK [Sphingopyxis sp.]
MSDLFGIGTSALRAYRTAMAATSENVANSETVGFARRTATIKEGPINNETGYVDFGGSRPSTVTRSWDRFVAAHTRTASANAEQADVRQSWLQRIENSFDDGAAGVGTSITALFNAGERLAADPTSSAGRAIFTTAMASTADAFRRTSTALSAVDENITIATDAEVNAVNNAMAALSNVNAALRTAAVGSTSRASLEDERDRQIGLVMDSLGGSFSLSSFGTATIEVDGFPVVQEGVESRLRVQRADDGTLSFTATSDLGTQAIAPSTGRLAALGESVVAVRRQQDLLDDLAIDTATLFNDWSAAGRTDAGTAGGALFSATGAASMAALTSNSADLALASSAGVNNGNLLDLPALRAANPVETRWATLVTDNAQALASAKAHATSSAGLRTNAIAELDSVTGVDLDTEAANLMRYQQAYNGAARIVQVAKDTLDSILALF